jgi:hypothetical protein
VSSHPLCTSIASRRLARRLRQSVALIPADEISRRLLAGQWIPPVGLLCCAVECKVDGLPYRKTNELGSLAILRGRHSLKIPSATIVEFDEELFHINKYILD